MAQNSQRKNNNASDVNKTFRTTLLTLSPKYISPFYPIKDFHFDAVKLRKNNKVS